MFSRPGPKHSFTLLLLLLWGMSLSGQKLEFSGKVLDAQTKESIPLIAVTLENTTIGSNTNLDGNFILYANPGTYILKVKYSGYNVFRDTIQFDSAITGFVVFLEPISINIEDVIITSKFVNPAHRIVRNAIKNKKHNKIEKLEAFEYESYNKLVLYMDKISSKFMDRKIMKGIREVTEEILGDTIFNDSAKIKIAGFVSESISHYYYKHPQLEKEEIYAVKTSGVNQSSEYNLLSSMYLQIDVYDNFVSILDKQFVSPVADGAFFNYDYHLTSTEIDGRDTLFGISILPKRDYDPVFIGTMFIDNHDWAINRIDLKLNKNPNINFVEDVRIRQEYAKISNYWVPVMLDLEVDFQNSPFKRKGTDWIGLIGRSSAYMYNYKLNEPKENKFYQQEILEIKAGASERDSSYWNEARKSPLDQAEILGYALVDTIMMRGVIDFYIKTAKFITEGTIKTKYFEIGPYFYLIGGNRPEGLRLRVGAYSRDALSKRFYIGGHLAYGFNDEEIKYQFEARYRAIIKPKLEFGIKKTYEVEQVGFENFVEEGTSLLETMMRRVPVTQLNYFQENKIYVNSDLHRNLSGHFFMRTKYFQPVDEFDFKFFNTETQEFDRNYSISETGMDLRISFKEKYITVGGDRLYIGSPYPIFHLKYSFGLSGFLKGDFTYHHLSLAAQNKWKLGRFGFLRYKFKVGQIFGTLPYPSLYVYRGNPTWALRDVGFNMLAYYEFIADRYMIVSIDHHLEGMIWSKIPLLRKLKFKEVLTARMAWGSLTQENIAINSVPAENGSPGFDIQAPTKPYFEAGFAIENILKVLRVDAVWRLNYHGALQNTGLHKNWGKMNNFGIRAHLHVRF